VPRDRFQLLRVAYQVRAPWHALQFVPAAVLSTTPFMWVAALVVVEL
jgi:hypothetical protein